MKKVNVALVRLLQFIVFVIFTLMVIVYFGALVLVPLDVLVMITKLMTAIGFNGFISVIIGVPIVGYLVLMVYKTPGLTQMLIDIGVDLVTTGKSRVEAFNKIAEAVK